jgi:DNA-binding MarR family transcriptional regulator
MVTNTKAIGDTVRAGEPDAPAHLAALKKLRIVIRAAQRHSAWIEKQCGVSGAQLWIMQELYEAPGLRVGELASRLAIHQTTASNLVRPLEKDGYVVKARDPADQRAVKLALSETGAALLTRAPKPARGLLPESLRHLDEKHLSQLRFRPAGSRSLHRTRSGR